MSHVALGMICLLGSVWLLVEVWHATASNLRRIGILSYVVAASFWVAFVVAGWWYVTAYKVEKAIILKGPWPQAHSFFMETKEHLAIILLLLTIYLPIAARNDLANSPAARRLVLGVVGTIALLALVMDGEGGVIAMGVKVGLLPR